MIKVYFESSRNGITSDGKFSYLEATFEEEDVYEKCFKELESFAKEKGMIVTESVQ